MTGSLLAGGHIVRARWRLALLIFLVVVGLGSSYAVVRVPEYQSVGTLRVAQPTGLSAGTEFLALAGGAGQGSVQSEVYTLRSRELTLEALRRERLHFEDPGTPRFLTLDRGILAGGSPEAPWLHEFRSSIERYTTQAAAFDVVEVKLEPTGAGKVVARWTDDEGEKESIIVVGEPTELAFGEVWFRRVPEIVEPRVVAILPDAELLEQYEPTIGVSSLGTVREPTELVQISVVHRDRVVAASLVDALMAEYLDRNLAWRSESAAQTASFIQREIEATTGRLATAEDALSDYSVSERAVELDEQARTTIEELARLEAERASLELQSNTYDAVLKRISARGSATGNFSANFFVDPAVEAVVQSLVQEEIALSELEASLSDTHPEVARRKREIRKTRGEAVRIMRTSQANLESEITELDSQIDRTEKVLVGYPEKELRVARLVRDVELQQQLYMLLVEELQRADILRAATTIDKRVIDAASLPHKPARPVKKKVFAGAVAAGLVLSLGVVLVFGLTQRTLNTETDVTDATGLPVLARIPRIKESPAEIQERWKTSSSAFCEAFKSAGVSVALGRRHVDRANFLLVTSSMPQEGKSTSSAHLAVALARSGRRTLLIDMDLRRPVQHRRWAERRVPGLAEVLIDAVDAAEVVRRPFEDQPLSVVLAGAPLPDPVAGLMSPQLESLLDGWATEYDWIVIDTPPLTLAESSWILSRADQVLLVARPEFTEKAALRRSLEKLAHMRSKIGLVLNDLRSLGRTEYYYYGEENPGEAATEPKVSARRRPNSPGRESGT